MIQKIKFALLVLCAALATPAAAETASRWATTNEAQVRLISAAATTGESGRITLGFQFILKPGWKTYWRSPGDAGLPPKLDWTESRNLASAEIKWPAPERFELFGLDTFGYGGEVVLPIDVKLAQPDEALALSAKLDYLVCEKLCIPYDAQLSLTVPAGSAQPSEYAHLIDQFTARVPGEGARAGLAIERAEWNGGQRPMISVVATASEPFVQPELLIEGPQEGVWRGTGFGKPEVILSDNGRRAVLRAPARLDITAGPNADLSGAPVTLTLIDGARAMEGRATLAAGAPAPTIATPGLAVILGIALLGGLILNLMPCVLPVLSLKLLSLVDHAGAPQARVRRNFIASAVGVMVSFLVLAGGLIGLQAAGAAIGWGVQFQQPAFIAFMVLLLTAFAANLWGLIEFRLPSSAATTLAGHGGDEREEGAFSAFLTGAFATLLATPCSAPFVGTAVGFALARGPLEIVAIFVALGLGLAAPYLAVAAAPGLIARLPRPGRWMAQVRAILGVALAATALWLIFVLYGQAGMQAAVALGLCMAGLLAALALLRTGAARVAAAAVVVIAAFAAPSYLIAAPDRPVSTAWRPFDLAEIGAQVRAGRTVFVDVTADWCLTCQVNKAVVLSRGDVAARLNDGRVTPMRADWTRPDESIARYLASFGRYGIPFNVVYGPGAPSGIVLPELLTGDAVRDALNRAGG